MVAAVVTAMLVLQTAQAHPAPNGFPFPNLITRLQDVSVLLTAPRTTYVAGEDVRIHVRVVILQIKRSVILEECPTG
jgi:hypothetical protein